MRPQNLLRQKSNQLYIWFKLRNFGGKRDEHCLAAFFFCMNDSASNTVKPLRHILPKISIKLFNPDTPINNGRCLFHIKFAQMFIFIDECSECGSIHRCLNGMLELLNFETYPPTATESRPFKNQTKINILNQVE